MEKDLKRAPEKSDEESKKAKLESILPTPVFPESCRLLSFRTPFFPGDLDDSVTCSEDVTPGRVSTRKNRRKMFRDSNGNRPLVSKKLVEDLAEAMEEAQVNQEWTSFIFPDIYRRKNLSLKKTSSV